MQNDPRKKNHIFREYKMLFDIICLSYKRADWNLLKCQMKRSSIALQLKNKNKIYSKLITQIFAQKMSNNLDNTETKLVCLIIKKFRRKQLCFNY